MNIKKEFSVKLRQTRKGKKLTQEQAAELLEVSVRWYQQVEDPKSKSLPGFHLCCMLTKHFDFDLLKFADMIEEDIASREYF